MSIKEEVNRLKKELLLKEASKLFEEIGYEQMKVADLAKTAQVSVGTIYTLFQSKEGLYLAYIEHQINRFFIELQEKIAQDASAKEKIYAFIELKFTYYSQKRRAIEQSATNNPLFFNTLAKEHSLAFEKIYAYLEACFLELNPQFDRAKAMRMAFALNGFSDGYISLWLEMEDDLMEKVDEVSSLFITMVEQSI